ncbi:DUF4271 domain-containing protein [Eudoraea chungangensis]|uniref:DUF4271 domain-containing protein n=1 Tax=Eudoraea chungangensis TaxID=1481905 RepID=UPI0023EB1579|nr:DUF4271 domain-containing protein [Eudoraea chungangensis]
MEATNRFVENFDGITIIMVISLLMVAIAKTLFYNRFTNFIILPFNNKYISLYNKKDKLVNWFHIFFSVFQLLNFSIYIYYISKILFEGGTQDYLLSIFLILSLLILYLLSKILLQLGGGVIFNNHRVIVELIFRKLTYLNYSGIIMLLANIILSYIIPNSKIVLFISIFLIGLINLIGWVRIIKNYQILISGYFFYFILYLCALEIAPFVIIANYLKD